MKKRYLALILILSLMLPACGAQKSPEKTGTAETELSVNKYRLIHGGICETEHFFFGGHSTSRYLYYYDKENGVSDYLCADPSCTHNSESCGAFVGMAILTTFYEGKRYWITYGTEETSPQDATMWCSDLEGTNRKRIKMLSFESMGQYCPQFSVIYQGKLYMMGLVNVVDGVQVGNRITLLRTSLDGKEEVEILFDDVYSLNVHSWMNFVGDDVYFGVNTWTEDGFESIKIERINLTTKEQETAFEETDIPEMIGNMHVTEAGEIYISGVRKFWKIENGQRTLVSEFAEGEDTAEIDDGIVIQAYLDGSQWYIEVQSLEGTMLYRGKVFPDGVEGLKGNPNSSKEYTFGICGGDREKLLVEIGKYNIPAEKGTIYKSQKIKYFLTLDLNNNMTPTLLWTATQ